MFNHRRQSQDRLLRENLLAEAGGRSIWMSPYSRKQFVPTPENIRTAEDFPRQAGPGELCFFEDVFPGPWLDQAERIVVYHWNRTYPSDPPRFPLPLAGRSAVGREEFAGSSHERITKEIWV